MKKVLFVQQRPPYGTLFGKEGLDAILMGSAFVECSVYFSGDGIFQVLKNQKPGGLGVKNYSVTYGALKDYGVSALYVSGDDMKARGIEPDDLLVPVQALENQQIRALFKQHSVVLSF